MSVQLSAVVITYNEEKNIQRCLDSLQGVADEIVVVDSYSTDRTKEICTQYQVKFLEHAFEGHIEQKNWAKDQAGYDFILSLDADDALDKELKEAILKVKENWNAEVYSMNRLTNYCGNWIYHSGWYPDKKMRLFPKSLGEWGGVNPHDRLIVGRDTEVRHLEGNILHYSYYSREEHIAQIHKFSSIGAKALHQQGVRSSWLKLLIKPMARFIKNFIVFRGFLDGRDGFTISRLSAYANYLKYSKLLKLQKGRAI
mgnify:CR=1 FL=1